MPTNGVEFSFRSKYSSYATPELAVYSNGQFAGQIQVWGTKSGQICIGDFREIYTLYIPPEKLQAGTNVLRLEAATGPFPTVATADQYYLVGWDYLRMQQLTSPATEPTHGRVVYAGTIMMQNTSQKIDADTVRFTQPTLEWLGIAYSGNTMRANFWKNRLADQPSRMDLLLKYRDLNMSVVMDYMSGNHAGTLDGDGSLNAGDEGSLSSFLSTYGSLFQYYEVSNEPAGISNEPLDKNIAIAKYMQLNKPSHMKVAAPGYPSPAPAARPTDGKPTPSIACRSNSGAT